MNPAPSTPSPPAFETAFRRYADRILHYGYAEDLEGYANLLHRADLDQHTHEAVPTKGFGVGLSARRPLAREPLRLTG